MATHSYIRHAEHWFIVAGLLKWFVRLPLCALQPSALATPSASSGMQFSSIVELSACVVPLIIAGLASALGDRDGLRPVAHVNGFKTVKTDPRAPFLVEQELEERAPFFGADKVDRLKSYVPVVEAALTRSSGSSRTAFRKLGYELESLIREPHMAPLAKPSGGINVQHEGPVDPRFKGGNISLCTTWALCGYVTVKAEHGAQLTLRHFNERTMSSDGVHETQGLTSKENDKFPWKHDNSLTRPTIQQTKKDSIDATSSQLLEHPQSVSSSTNKLNSERAREQDLRGAKPVVHFEVAEDAMGIDLELMYAKLNNDNEITQYDHAITEVLRKSSPAALFGEGDYKIACEKLKERLRQEIDLYKMTLNEHGEEELQRIIHARKASEDKRDERLVLENGQFASWFMMDKAAPVPASRKAQDADELVEHRDIAPVVMDDYEKFVIRTLKYCRGLHLPLPTDSEKFEVRLGSASFDAGDHKILCSELERGLHDDIFMYKNRLSLLGNVATQQAIQGFEVTRDGATLYSGMEGGQFAHWFIMRIDPQRARLHALSVSSSAKNNEDAENVMLKYRMFIDKQLVKIRGRHLPLAAGGDMPPVFVPFGDDGHKRVCDELKRDLKKNIEDYSRHLTYNGNVATQRTMYKYRDDESEFNRQYAAEIEKGQFAYWFINKVDPGDVRRQAISVGRTPDDREIAHIVANEYTQFIQQKLKGLSTI
ncbi:unnamed protein product [Hyaloperonospora brassicae]|uniref:RxLR effector candidate protein n=1 Tax=Hyaloperonospora brassicae TaxID=162125 RepID=A0AAV0USM5_HYABA|nr:unnamed protein product [Hyaloperonospora brassicae]